MADRPAAERREELVALYNHLRDCHDCPLKATRTKLVFGAGNANADVMFVGEAPGQQEDIQGLPFVGRAGRLLNDLLHEIELDRQDVFIANVLMCRPPGNRDPQPDEIAECEPHLLKKIALIEPKVICTLGNFSTKLLSGQPTGITRVHGRPQERELGGRPVVLYPLFHPAAALRTPATKELLRADIHRLPEILERYVPGDPEPEEAADPEAEQLGLFAGG
jgi:DNA polymerase